MNAGDEIKICEGKFTVINVTKTRKILLLKLSNGLTYEYHRTHITLNHNSTWYTEYEILS